MIKNAGLNLNTVSSSYSAQKADKLESTKGETSSVDSAKKINSGLASSKMDTIEISYQPLQDSSSVSDVKNQIVNEVNKDAETQRVQNLKEQVNNGLYSVDPNEMAAVLLGDE